MVDHLRLRDGNYRRLAATIDTGADVSLFPQHLLDELDYQLLQSAVTVQQAGIARQEFTANIALVKLFLEDQYGVRSAELAVPILFAEDTDEVLIGFDGLLDKAKLYIDMLDSRTGWIELAP